VTGAPPSRRPRVAGAVAQGRPADGEAWTAAVDVGGTFTDAIAIGSAGGLRVVKVPSTPDDPSRAFLAALSELERRGAAPAAIGLVCHGTTVATNALLTGRLARVVVVMTRGFRDVLGFRSGSRPQLYSLAPTPPLELAARCDRLEVAERLDHRGGVVTALTHREAERVAAAVAERQPDAVAVALLFSYRNDAHEVRLAEAIARRLPGVPVTRSAACAREYREYPRTATAALNAALRPVVGRYLLQVERGLDAARVRGRLVVMQSNGGTVAAERAEREAHRLVLSGPAGGVAGAAELGRRHGLDRLISMDMGGTSLDVCLVDGGVPPVRPEQRVGGHPILCPAVDVVAIGAGGGSLARVDRVGRLRVGPESAGASPGPAAYGLGGTCATVTDAHVVAGTLGTKTRLAGRIALDPDAARQAVRRVGRGLGLDAESAAVGILAVTLAQIAGALRRVSVERGIDPRGCTLVAFGGAGPLHAGQLLREVGLRQALIPAHPGCFAASGLIASDLRMDEARTVLWPLQPGILPEVAAWFRSTVRALAAALARDGAEAGSVRCLGSVDCRYLGQGYALGIPLGGTTPAALGRLRRAFDAAHHAAYGHASRTEPVELVTLRVAAFGTLATEAARPRPAAGAGPAPHPIALRRVRLPLTPRAVAIPVYRREQLAPTFHLRGPALVEQMDATTLVLAGQSLDGDGDGDCWLRETPAA